MKQITLLVLFVFTSLHLFGQNDSVQQPKLSFTGDFRFRAEQDWDSKKSDGNYRDDRTRLRYRLRFGFNYTLNNWASFGARIRTGDPIKQQDPHLTLGTGSKEFGTVPVSFEKLFFKAKHKGLTFWAGKNSYPFYKNNELFWSDNVYPEGVFLKKAFQLKSFFLNKVELSGGHFIISSDGTSLNNDSYFQGAQAYISFFKNKIIFFPSFYFFNNMPDIPDGGQTYRLNYSIFHTGTKVKLIEKPALHLEFDYFSNIENYDHFNAITSNFKDQKNGWVAGLSFGKLKEKKDLAFKISYAYMQQLAAVDFLAQNDWARWDYSSMGSPDSRLTNFKGLEIVGAMLITKDISLKMKYYFVEQLIAIGTSTETGSRIRLDLDVKF